MNARRDDPVAGRVLSRDVYAGPVEAVARTLLGCFLIHDRAGGVRLGGRIIEVEAYGGIGDPGSHADRAGGPRGRAAIMFGEPGHAYVYFTYGMHFCLNAVTDAPGTAGAVLIRAVEPRWGIEAMREATASALPDTKLASGPGRVCRALGIDRAHNGVDLTSGYLRIHEGPPADHVHRGLRVGLTLDDGRRWRFWTSSPSVSRGPVTSSPARPPGRRAR